MLSLLMLAADPAPNWDAGRQKIESIDTRSFIEASHEALPLRRAQDLDWDLEDDFEDLSASLEAIDHVDSGDACPDDFADVLNWYDHCGEVMQRRCREALQEMSRRAVSRLEYGLPGSVSQPNDADIAMVTTDTGLLYIAATHMDYEYDGTTPVFAALQVMADVLPSILDACGFYVPRRIEVSRYSYE